MYGKERVVGSPGGTSKPVGGEGRGAMRRRYLELRIITPAATKVCMILWSFVVFNMDVWYYRISVACDIME